MNTATASIIAVLTAVLVAASGLLGVVLTLRVGSQQRAHDERVQARRDELAQREVQAYRNHERRANAAKDYIVALNRFRRGVRDLNEKDKEALVQVQAYARASADAEALVDLYFSKTVQDLSADAAKIVADMHTARSDGGLRGTAMKAKDNDAKAARDMMINEMKRELGELENGQRSG
jgi:Ni/Co efflux regulator RcnB